MTGECRSWETITYEPVLDVAWCSFNFDLTSPQTYPFAIYWGIFCSGWRAEAEEAITDPTFGLTFLFTNRFKKASGPTGSGGWSTRAQRHRLALRTWSLPSTAHAPGRGRQVLRSLPPRGVIATHTVAKLKTNCGCGYMPRFGSNVSLCTLVSALWTLEVWIHTR